MEQGFETLSSGHDKASEARHSQQLWLLAYDQDRTFQPHIGSGRVVHESPPLDEKRLVVNNYYRREFFLIQYVATSNFPMF